MKIYRGILIVVAIIFIYACGSNQKKEDKTEKSIPTELKILSDRVDQDSTNADYWNARANYYIKNQEINKALSDINKAIQVNPENALYYITLSDIYLIMGDGRRCLTALLKANNVDSDNKEALLKLAEINLIFKNYDKVFEYLNKSLELDKMDPVIYFMRGFTFAEIGDTANAIRNMQIAIDQDQQYYDAYFHLGLIHDGQGNELAEAYYDNAINVNPSSIEALYAKAMFQQSHLKINEAIASYEQIINVDPNFKNSYYNLGYINLVYLEEFERATDYFSQVIERDDQYVDAYINRGYSFELLGKYIYARNDYQKALDLKPNYQRAVDGMNRLDRLIK